MRAKELKKELKNLVLNKIPVFIWGSPGIGKSSIVRDLAKELEFEFIDLRLTLMDPTDLKGIPFFDAQKKEAIWAKPNFLPSDEESKGILFLDEINSAPPSVQASAYQLILDRRVGDYELPKGWSIVAAGNNESDRGVVYRMPSPLANRFVHIDMEVSFDDWKSWAYQKGVDSSIIAFLNYKQDMLFNFDPNSNQKAFASPRSWEYVDKILKSNPSQNSLSELISGAVGEREAMEFLGFKKVLHRLPDIKDIFEEKDIKIDDDPEVLFALISSLISHLKKDPSQKNIVTLIKFSHSLPSEFAVMLIKDMQESFDIQNSKEWDDWVERFSYLL